MHNYRINALAILIFFISLYSLFSIGHFGGDGYQDYLTAESIVLDGNLSLYDRPGDEDEINYISVKGIKGRDGKIYSSRGALGIPLVLSLFYFIGNLVASFFKNLPHDFITMFFCSFANPVISAFNCFLIFLICKYLKFNIKIATIVTFIYGLMTMIPAYTRTGFTEPALILTMLLGFYSSLKYRDNPKILYLLFSGICTSLIVFVRVSGLIFVPIFIFYAVWNIIERPQFKTRLRDILVFMISFLVPFSFILIYNSWIYGSLLNFGKSNVIYYGTRIMASTHFLKGLYYYLLSPGKSLFIFNPVLVLAVIALFSNWEERKKEHIFFTLIFVVNLLFYVKSFRRGSLFSWGPRYLLPSVTFFIFFIGDYIERHRNFLARISLACLSIIGFFIVLPCMFINQSKFYFFVKEKLNLSEYMINFIPDLSPILGAWTMFISRLAHKFFDITLPFIYSPDYRLIPEITAKMEGYNYFDLWFLKIINYAPDYQNLVFIILGIMIFSTIASLLTIIKFYGQNLE